jgi:hypothetical protein
MGLLGLYGKIMETNMENFHDWNHMIFMDFPWFWEIINVFFSPLFWDYWDYYAYYDDQLCRIKSLDTITGILIMIIDDDDDDI